MCDLRIMICVLYVCVCSTFKLNNRAAYYNDREVLKLGDYIRYDYVAIYLHKTMQNRRGQNESNWFIYMLAHDIHIRRMQNMRLKDERARPFRSNKACSTLIGYYSLQEALLVCGLLRVNTFSFSRICICWYPS